MISKCDLNSSKFYYNFYFDVNLKPKIISSNVGQLIVKFHYFPNQGLYKILNKLSIALEQNTEINVEYQNIQFLNLIKNMKMTGHYLIQLSQHMICLVSKDDKHFRNHKTVRKVGVKYKVQLFVYYQFFYRLSPENKHKLLHTSYNIYQMFVSNSLQVGDCYYGYVYKTCYEFNEENINNAILIKTADAYIPQHNGDFKTKQIRTFLAENKNRKYVINHKFYIGIKIFLKLITIQMSNNIINQYKKYHSSTDRKYGVHHLNSCRRKSFYLFKYIYDSKMYFPFSASVMEKAKKVANGLRLIPDDHIPEYAKKLIKFMKQRTILANSTIINQYAENFYFGSDNIHHSSIYAHQEWEKFKELYVVSIGKDSALSLGLKNNSYNGLMMVDLPPLSITKFDS